MDVANQVQVSTPRVDLGQIDAGKNSGADVLIQITDPSGWDGTFESLVPDSLTLRFEHSEADPLLVTAHIQLNTQAGVSSSGHENIIIFFDPETLGTKNRSAIQIPVKWTIKPTDSSQQANNILAVLLILFFTLLIIGLGFGAYVSQLDNPCSDPYIYKIIQVLPGLECPSPTGAIGSSFPSPYQDSPQPVIYTDTNRARQIMGQRFIDITSVNSVSTRLFSTNANAFVQSAIPYTEAELIYARDHGLYLVAMPEMTLAQFRDFASGYYWENQDWFYNWELLNVRSRAGYHLIGVIPNSINRTWPNQLQMLPQGYISPNVTEMAYLQFIWLFLYDQAIYPNQINCQSGIGVIDPVSIAVMPSRLSIHVYHEGSDYVYWYYAAMDLYRQLQ